MLCSRMGIVNKVSAALSGSTGSGADDVEVDASRGAYWCDDCSVRVRDVTIEDEGLDRDEAGTPLCPDCGGSMRFERTYADGCAC
jgi:Zn finger protein HypA/HybF involved in hydrogenase expression